MAEGIRFEIHLHVLGCEAEFLLEIPAGVKQVAADAFPADHVLVTFDPLAGRHFPASLLDPLADRVEGCRVILLDQVIIISMKTILLKTIYMLRIME